jgi:hypothetical protein
MALLVSCSSVDSGSAVKATDNVPPGGAVDVALPARYRAARDQMADATDEARAIARRARGEAELTKVEIAGILDVQRPTLDRWIDGPNSPFERRLRAQIAATHSKRPPKNNPKATAALGTTASAIEECQGVDSLVVSLLRVRGNGGALHDQPLSANRRCRLGAAKF